MKNKKRIGQKCECFFTGAAMLCKLHAAAPELLAACIEAEKYLPTELKATHKAAKMLRAAIAKAEGR